MKSLSRKADFTMTLAGIITAAVIVGMMFATSGCHAVKGACRDVSEASDLGYSIIETQLERYYANREANRRGQTDRQSVRLPDVR